MPAHVIPNPRQESLPAPGKDAYGEWLRSLVRTCPAGVKNLVAAAVLRLEAGQIPEDLATAFVKALRSRQYATRALTPEAKHILAQAIGISEQMLDAKLEALRVKQLAKRAAQPPAVRQGAAIAPRRSVAQSQAPRAAPQQPRYAPQTPRYVPTATPQYQNPVQGSYQAPPSTLSGLQGQSEPVANNGWPWWVWGLMVATAWYVFVKVPNTSTEEPTFDKPHVLVKVRKNPVVLG